MEQEMNDMYGQMGEVSPEELEQLLEDVGTIQDTLTNQDFYMIDAKIEETARGLGLTDIGWIRMLTISAEGSGRRFCWRSCCWRSRTFCYWMSLRTIWTNSILNG